MLPFFMTLVLPTVNVIPINTIKNHSLPLTRLDRKQVQKMPLLANKQY